MTRFALGRKCGIRAASGLLAAAAAVLGKERRQGHAAKADAAVAQEPAAGDEATSRSFTPGELTVALRINFASPW